MSYSHIPVLLKEAIELLAPKSGGVYLDGTIGGGGYAEAILIASAPNGTVFGIDVDDEAVEASRLRLAKFGKRAIVEKGSYADVVSFAQGHNIKFDGIILDIGISSHQIDSPERGFSFLGEGPLDMRMDTRNEITAKYIVNNYTGPELEKIFKEFGEERFARRIAERIVKARGIKKIEMTADLEEICYLSYPKNLRRGRIHPATRVFQALRIVVNNELQNLEKFLNGASGTLNDDGKLVIASYHSLEDRMVKNKFRELAKTGEMELLTKKPVVPSTNEINLNPRARSAKLRGLKIC